VLTALLCAAALLFFSQPNFGQPALQVLQNNVPPEVSNGQAAFVSPLPSDEQLYFSIVLPLRNQAALDDLIQRLYDPSSPDYRQFLTVDQFTELFGPTQDDYNAVVNFAQANGFTVTDNPPNRLIVPVKATAAQIENAFHLKMNLYQHPTEDRLFFSPDRDPSLNLNVLVKGISGLSNFSVPRPAASIGKSQANAQGSGPGGTSYLPSDMRAAYYGSGPLTGSGQCVGLAEFDGYYISDVVSTFDGYASATTNGNNFILAYTPKGGGSYSIPINNVVVNGSVTPLPNAPYNSEGEVVLDIAQAIGMAPGISQLRVYIAQNGDHYDLLNKMASENVCKQLSLSWTWPQETNDESVFLQMQSQGQSFFVASGDEGSWITNSTCSEYPYTCYVYPPESPNVIAVGGTVLATNGSGGSWASESGWSYSGGGISPDLLIFSSYPNFQTGLNGINQTSRTYRNAPDVAMEANNDNYNCAFKSGCSGYWEGTSFAAPRWAGFLALVNQQATASYESPIGNINYYIYPIGEGSNYLSDFNKIVGGSNGAYSVPSPDYYNMVTGWGSPKGQSLINALAPPVTATPYTISAIVESYPWEQVTTYNVSLGDNTPGATIYYSWWCGSYSGNGSISYPPGSFFAFTQGNCYIGGDMYATAPGYAQSATVPIYF